MTKCEKTEVFGHPVYKFHCDKSEIYLNRRLSESLDLLLDLPLVVNRARGGKYDSAYGDILTSAGNEYSDIVNMPGSEDLVRWVTDCLLSLKPTASRIRYKRTWCNKMFRNSEGLVHAHNHPDYHGDIDFVAIFYVHNEIESGNLIFVEDGEFNTRYHDYERRISIACQSGDMLVHGTDPWHGISVWKSDTPRVCLCFEGRYE